MMEKLKVINLAKSYDRDVPVLRDISFCVDDRDFFVILGPSGCGKTTLLNIIAGVEDINGGEIYIDGIRVNENKPQKRDVAMVFQNYALYPTMNVFDNIAFPLRNRHFKKKEIEGKEPLSQGRHSSDDVGRNGSHRNGVHYEPRLARLPQRIVLQDDRRRVSRLRT